MTKVLVTGGAGYIGSHTVLALLEQGYKPVILDDFSNSQPAVIDRIQQITSVRPELVKADIRDRVTLDTLFTKNQFDAVIHFAGLKAVGESVRLPLKYYLNNIEGSLVLFEAMQQHDCRRIIFSSSATVYGEPASVPIKEDFPLHATNPYGQTKLMVENILRDLSAANNGWQVALLRYFNPIAAHESGLIGEDPNGIPNNLLPYIAQVGVGKLDTLSVFGDDYETPDGTGIRDYIHVCDLAEAHIKALKSLDQAQGCKAYNIGTGEGYSVLQVVSAFEKASGVTIPIKIEPRRAGDVASCYADPSYSENVLGWKALRDLTKMMEDQWRWQLNSSQMR